MHQVQKAELEQLDNLLADLKKTWPNIQIFVNRTAGPEELSVGLADIDNTIWMSKGVGNWFARRGQVQDWIISQNEAERITQRNESGPEED